MDPVILHEPSHVSLHHLYAQSIRENMLVLSSTTRNGDLYLQYIPAVSISFKGIRERVGPKLREPRVLTFWPRVHET